MSLQTGQSTPTLRAAQTPQARLSTPFSVIEPNRLAISPILDGKLDDEEWDPLGSTADGSKTYFEWEPGKLHGAAVVPKGHDAVFSFDLDANGWLQGKDNLEVRLSVATGNPVATVRLLDATNTAGPTWIELPGMSISTQVASSSDLLNTTFEFSMSDPGMGVLPQDAGDSIAVRVDDPPSADPPFEPYLPRLMSSVRLGFFRAAGLPSGIEFSPELAGKSYVPGEKGKVRLTFKGSNTAKLQRLEMHTEGAAKNDTNMLAMPFPVFDAKGRCFADYNTDIRESSPIGFRVLKATVTAGDGLVAVLETSYRIGPLADLSLIYEPIAVASMDRSVKISYYLRSNSTRSINGSLSVSVPEPLRLVNTPVWDFQTETSRGRLRQNLELYVPAGLKGVFPLRFTGDAKGKQIDQTLYLTIGGQ